MSNTMRIKNTDNVMEEVREWRRYLHKHPELSFEERNTSDFVYEKLKEFGGMEVSRPTETSVMARLIGEEPGKTIALRADMDALPIEEETAHEFKSTNKGVMHACGHDGHTSMLLGAAKVLSGKREEISGEVRFLFQHAEERFPGGASEMVEAGVMEGVDFVIGTHLMSDLEIGKVGFVPGPMMASTDGFWVTVQGEGGHGGMPHQTVDSIVIASQVVSNLQQIISRNVDPLDMAVLTIGKFVGGEAANVIADAVKIDGTVRTFDPKYKETMPGLVERVIKGVTEAHGATYSLDYVKGYDPVINDEEALQTVEKAVRNVYGEEAVDYQKPKMGAEDFSGFLKNTPGAFVTIGAGNEEKGITHPHHHPKFDIDEDALEYGVNIFVNTIAEYLM